MIFCDDRKLERIKQNSLTSQKSLLVQAFTVSEISWRQGVFFCLRTENGRLKMNFVEKNEKKNKCVLLLSIIPKETR